MPVFRVTNIILFLLLIIIISYTYVIKNNSHYLNREEVTLNKQIEITKNKIARLQIELAYLTSPFYINKTMSNNKDLNLEAINPKNIVTIDSLPKRTFIATQTNL